MNIEEKLSEIFSVVFDLADNEDPREFRRMTERRWDSLAHASIIAAIESEYSLQLEVKDWERISSFESACILVEEKMG